MKKELSEENYVPKIKGAKELGGTEIWLVDRCGGYKLGGHEYEAVLPDGSKVYNDTINDNLLGLKKFKKDRIKPWYKEHLKKDKN